MPRDVKPRQQLVFPDGQRDVGSQASMACLSDAPAAQPSMPSPQFAQGDTPSFPRAQASENLAATDHLKSSAAPPICSSSQPQHLWIDRAALRRVDTRAGWRPLRSQERGPVAAPQLGA